ncbi:MAG: hypothetical protein JOZ58_14870 [Acetobacteraceae bacterium]|nr:hypothetical protein [Acetobacteraceae bacterium]
MGIPELRRELEADVIDAVGRLGEGGVRRAEIVEKYAARGVPKSTAYRWIGSCIESGRPAAHLARVVRNDLERRRADAAHTGEASVTDRDVAESLARDAEAVLPRSLLFAEGTGVSVSQVILKLHECIAMAEQVARYSRNADGSVRNAKLLLAASENMRRNVDSIARLIDAARDVAQVEKFHQAVFDVIRSASPELAGRLLAELRGINDRFSLEA